MENEIIEEVKTFTQEEVNEIVQKEKRRFEKSQISPEEFEELKANKTKTDEEFSALKIEHDKLVNELADSRTNAKLVESKANDIDYVKYKVTQLMADGESFDDALDRFKNDNPKYFGESKPKPSIQTITQTNGGALDEWLETLEKSKGRK